jgi:AraC-like DNA-binding protein
LAGRASELEEPHSASETLRLSSLYTGTQLSVHDVRCRPHDFEPGAEECSRLHQIVFPRRGVFERVLRGERLLADPTRVLFFARDEPYRVAHPAGCGDDCTAFSFNDALLREALAQHEPALAARATVSFRFAHALSDAGLTLAHEQLRAALHQPGPQLAVEEAAFTLLSAALACAYRGRAGSLSGRKPNLETQRAQREKARETALFLATHFSEEQSLDEIGRAVHCSSFHLARLFRRELGLTLHQYRHTLRLREALRRVADGETNLTQLALALGFASHSHLTDSFRRAFGQPPRSLRSELALQRDGLAGGAARLDELSRNLQVGPRLNP